MKKIMGKLPKIYAKITGMVGDKIIETNHITDKKNEKKVKPIDVKKEKLLNLIKDQLRKKIENRDGDVVIINNDIDTYQQHSTGIVYNDTLIKIAEDAYYLYIAVIKRKKIENWEENEDEENDTEYIELKKINYYTSKDVELTKLKIDFQQMMHEIELERELDEILELLDYE